MSQHTSTISKQVGTVAGSNNTLALHRAQLIVLIDHNFKHTAIAYSFVSGVYNVCVIQLPEIIKQIQVNYMLHCTNFSDGKET